MLDLNNLKILLNAHSCFINICNRIIEYRRKICNFYFLALAVEFNETFLLNKQDKQDLEIFSICNLLT